MSNDKKISFRALMIIATVVWVAIGIFLILYWSVLPKYIAWPLAILEAAIGSDARMLKIAFGLEDMDGKKPND